MSFLHEGRPAVVREATWTPPAERRRVILPVAGQSTSTADLLTMLAHWNVCSKEWIIRQYDHEVQGGSVIKPLVGVTNDGPGDAAVVMPVLRSHARPGCRLRHESALWRDRPVRMAACAIDEAVRNCVAVGADPQRIAILDNFCWGNTERPETLGSLVLRPLPAATSPWLGNAVHQRQG